jgi:hypothetical protein
MSGRFVKSYSGCLAVLGCLLAISGWLWIFHIPRGVDIRILLKLKSCKLISDHIATYYEQSPAKSVTPDSFAAFVARSDPRFSVSRPVVPDEETEAEVFLMLPKALTEHTGEIIVMYTDPVDKGEHEGMRGVILLREGAMEVRRLSPSEFQSRLPEEFHGKGPPDLYYSGAGFGQKHGSLEVGPVRKGE